MALTTPGKNVRNWKIERVAAIEARFGSLECLSFPSITKGIVDHSHYQEVCLASVIHFWLDGLLLFRVALKVWYLPYPTAVFWFVCVTVSAQDHMLVARFCLSCGSGCVWCSSHTPLTLFVDLAALLWLTPMQLLCLLCVLCCGV